MKLWERRAEAPKEELVTMVIESLMSSPKFERVVAAKFGEEYNATRVRGSDRL